MFKYSNTESRMISIQSRSCLIVFIYLTRSGFLVTALAASSLGPTEADSASETEQVEQKKLKKGPRPILVP